MHPGRILRVRDRRLHPVLCAVTTIAASLAFAAPASAHFPVPRCGWAKPSLIAQTFGVQVYARKGYWRTKLSPILHCNYVEQQPNFQEGGVPIVRLVFREIQRFKVSPGMVPVKALGSCRIRVSCPSGQHQAAWVFSEDSASSLLPTPFMSTVVLGVEDGLNMISIEVVNPFGPLPVANEQAAAIRLARRLVPRFRYH
jgi:hypothetical protein